MTLIIYPAADANSFITLQEANDILDYNVDHYIWETYSDDDKMRYLVKAYKKILSIIEEEDLPDPIHDCIKESQANLALKYITNKALEEENRIKSEKLGPMSLSYQSRPLAPELITEEIGDCLSQWGYLTFTNTVGSILKTRYQK